MILKQMQNISLSLIASLLILLFFTACFEYSPKDDEESEDDDAVDDDLDDDAANCQVNNDGAIRYCVSADSNSDGHINSGETVELSIFLTNQTSSDYDGATVTVSSTSSYVDDIRSSSSETVDIDAGQEVELTFSDQNFQFTLAENTPVGETIIFKLDISDSDDNEWESEFSVEVVVPGANIDFSRYVISNDDNENGDVNPGETIDIGLYVKNAGSSSAIGVVVTISTESPHVEWIQDATSSATDIDDGEEVKLAFSYGDFSFRLTESAPAGQIDFDMDIEAGQGNNWQSQFSITVIEE
jgi:hypothetical protein